MSYQIRNIKPNAQPSNPIQPTVTASPIMIRANAIVCLTTVIRRCAVKLALCPTRGLAALSELLPGRYVDELIATLSTRTYRG